MTRVPVRIIRTPVMLPPWAIAMVPLKRTILVVRRHALTITELAHELAHVQQAERHPWPFAYVTQWVASGFDYHGMPFEAEARRASREPFYRAWAHDLLGRDAPP